MVEILLGNTGSHSVKEDADVGGRGASSFKEKRPRVTVDNEGLLGALGRKDREGVLAVWRTVHLRAAELFLSERKTP